MNRTIPLLAGSFLLSLLCSASVIASQQRFSEVITVQQASGTPTIALGGTVFPYKEVTLAAQLPGRVKFLAGIEGDGFDKAELLVALDDTELLAKRSAVMAQYSSAQTQLRNAGVQYSRELWSPRSRSAPGGMGMPNLFDQMFTGKMEDFTNKRDRDAERTADLFASSSQIEKAKSGLHRITAEIKVIDAKLRDARSLAPFKGVIIKKFIEEGDTVQPGQPLLKFADLIYLQVVVEVPARLSVGLKRGMMLKAELDIDGKKVPVRVAQVYPMADAQKHTLTVKFDLPVNTSSPGMYVKVHVPNLTAGKRAAVPVIPKSAIRYNGSLPSVYVINNNEPELRLVRLGEELDGGMISILSGLLVGERILSNPNSAFTSDWSANSKNK